MTAVQQQKIAEIREMIAEHFNGGVLVVLATSEDGKSVTHNAEWTVEPACALGLLELGKMFIMSDVFKRKPPPTGMQE